MQGSVVLQLPLPTEGHGMAIIEEECGKIDDSRTSLPQLTARNYLEHDVSLPPTVAETLWSRPYRALSIGALMLVAQSAFEYIAVATAMPTVARSLHGLNLYALAFG